MASHVPVPRGTSDSPSPGHGITQNAHYATRHGTLDPDADPANDPVTPNTGLSVSSPDPNHGFTEGPLPSNRPGTPSIDREDVLRGREDLRCTFGPLLDIEDVDILRLAIRVRRTVLNTETASAWITSRIYGSSNIVNIVQLDAFKLIIRLPAVWGERLDKVAERAMKSQVATLRYIACKTSIPVPKVYDYDTCVSNEIDAAYFCMSFLPGQTVADAWYDEDERGHDALDARRSRTMVTLIEHLCKLAPLRFSNLGSLEEKEGHSHLVVGPCFDWATKPTGAKYVVQSGPYRTARDFLQDRYDTSTGADTANRAESLVMDLLLSLFPVVRKRHRGFSLCPPDFDSQNVLVDREGNVTGFLDWDMVRTMPHCVSFCRFPGWLMRDWFPPTPGSPQWYEVRKWNWRVGDIEVANMQWNRMWYAMKMRKHQSGSGGDWVHLYTQHSQIYEAVKVAALNADCRPHLIQKLVETAVKPGGIVLDGAYEDFVKRLDEAGWQLLKSYLSRLMDPAC